MPMDGSDGDCENECQAPRRREQRPSAERASSWVTYADFPYERDASWPLTLTAPVRSSPPLWRRPARVSRSELGAAGEGLRFRGERVREAAL